MAKAPEELASDDHAERAATLWTGDGWVALGKMGDARPCQCIRGRGVYVERVKTRGEECVALTPITGPRWRRAVACDLWSTYLATVPTDIEIAQRTSLRPIIDVAAELGLGPDDLDTYGKYKAKVSLDVARAAARGRLVLVTGHQSRRLRAKARRRRRSD